MQRNIASLALFVFSASVAAACAPPSYPGTNRILTTPSALHANAAGFAIGRGPLVHAPLSAPFQWPGTYDVIGTNFPDGVRLATMTIMWRDTSYDIAVQGPPGVLHKFMVKDDSAHIVWDMREALMHVDLKGSGDSLEGRWQVGSDTGSVYGSRRK